MSDWTLLPTLVVRTTGFPWEIVDRLAHPRTAQVTERLAALADEADRLHAELRAGLRAGRHAAPSGGTSGGSSTGAPGGTSTSTPGGDAPEGGTRSGLRLTRGQQARLRNHRPMPADAPVPAGWLGRWNAVTERIESERSRLAEAAAEDERDAAAAIAGLVADPRFLDAVACSGPGVYRDIAKGRPTAARLRRQVASYAQRLAAKCETMSFFGPVNYAVVQPGLDVPAVLGWEGHELCPERRAYLSAWAFERLQADLLADPRLVATVVPRRKTFAAAPRGGTPLAALVGDADGRRSLAEIAGRHGLTPGAAARALGDAVRRGILTHDLIPPATEVDPVRWLAGRLRARAGAPDKRLDDVLHALERYPSADPAAKLMLQAELGGPDPAPVPGATADPAAPAGVAGAGGGRPKFYNDRVPVTEAAVGTLDLRIGGDLARDLGEAVPAVLDLFAHSAELTRRRTNGAVAAALGPGRFPFTRVLRDCGDLPVDHDPWLRETLARAIASAAPDAAELDLAGLLPAPPPPELPVLCSVDVMVATADLGGYRSGRTPLVIGDVHDAPLLTPWALQFRPDAAGILADRDLRITAALGGRRAVSVVARRSTGLPPLRFPGPVVELGPAGEPADRIPLDRLYVLSDGERARLLAAGRDDELFLHNGELDTGVHTAFALPRIRPPMLPDVEHLPRLRHGNVVLARRRWRLVPGPLDDLRDGRADGPQAVHRALREAGVPARFFAKASHERKPVYVDADSPLLLDGLLRLAKGAGTLHASELLPGPDLMWLREGGLRFAAELRCVYLRPAGTEGPR